MDREDEIIDLHQKRGNQEAGEAWYAGLNSPLDEDARTLCTILMAHLGVGPRSRGVEYILTALESGSDTHKQAVCLAEVMEHLANDPSDYYHRMVGSQRDFTSTHGFNHRAGDFYSALDIDERGQMQVMKIIVDMSKGILTSIFSSRSLSATKIGKVFERVLNVYSETDKKLVAAAIYSLLTAPILRPIKLIPSEPQKM